MTYASADEASAALASSEAVLGCDGVQLQLLPAADDAAAAAGVIQVMR